MKVNQRLNTDPGQLDNAVFGEEAASASFGSKEASSAWCECSHLYLEDRTT